MANNFVIKKGTTSKRLAVFIQDSSKADGSGLAGLVFNTASLTCYYWREDEGNAGATVVALATMTRGTWATLGFVEKDATNMPGWYEFGVPNAAIITGATWVKFEFKGAANMAATLVEIQLVSYDPDDAVRLGLTALPNAAANAAGGLPISTAGALDMDAVLSRISNKGYEGGWVWFDTGGAAGTTNYVNGVALNPNSSMANARTIANSLNLKGFRIVNGSTVTLDQGYNGFTFFGYKWTLALASRLITNSYFQGASVSGLSTGTGATFYDCIIGTVTIANDVLVRGCGLNGTFTVQAAGDFYFDQCFSAMPSGSDPILDFGALGATEVGFRHYAGGLEVQNMAAGDILEFAGTGRLTINANCTGGTVRIRGTIVLINNGSGQTLEDTSRYSEDQNVTNVTGTVAAITNVLGALADAAADGDPTATDTVMQYVKQLVNVLVGTAGVVTFPAAAAPGNGVSLAEVLRAVYDDTDVIGTPANLGGGATVAANLSDIEAQTDDIGIAGAGLTALGDARIANLDATVSSRSTVTVAQVNAEADAALVDVNLDHLVGTAVGIPAIPAGTYVDQMMDDGVAVYDRTTDSLQAIRDKETDIETDTAAIGAAGAGLTAVTDQVWDELIAGHLGVGSTGEALNAAGAAGDPWITALPGAYGAGSAGKIVGDNLNATVSSRAIAGDAMALTGGERTTLAGIIVGTVIEGAETLTHILRLIRAAVVGKSNTFPLGPANFRDAADLKNRITVTVDGNGNRTNVVTDGT